MVRLRAQAADHQIQLTIVIRGICSRELLAMIGFDALRPAWINQRPVRRPRDQEQQADHPWQRVQRTRVALPHLLHGAG